MIWWALGVIFGLAVIDKIIPMKKYGWVWATGFGVVVLGFVGLLAIAAHSPRPVATASMDKPLARKPPPQVPSLSWQANKATLACGTAKSIETLQFLDAIGRSQGLRNPASDASQTDCVHMRRGAKLGIYDLSFHNGISSVHVPKVGVRYMISADIEPVR